MSKNCCFVLFLFLSISSLGQKEDYVWPTDLQGFVDFNSNPPDTYFVNKPGRIAYTETSICSSTGNFLFYTNGGEIFNKYSDILLNGDSLSPCEYSESYSSTGFTITQGAIIIQRPNHSQQYYLFHETYDNDTSFVFPYYLCNVLYLTVVDMTLDGGKGGVTSLKNFHLHENDTLLAGYLTAVRHANGRDWWLISKKLKTPLFYKWLITPDTIMGPYKQSNQPASSSPYDDGFGQASFSNEGDKYAVMYNTGNLYLYGFDRCSGNLTYNFHVLINDSTNTGMGCTFSPSGRYLYAMTQMNIYQFDTWSGNIPASIIKVATYDGFASPSPPFYTHFNVAKLAPDGRIYISTDNGTDVYHYIEYPDSAGLACHVVQHGFHLAYGTASSTIPNIPNSKLGALQGSGCDTLTSVDNIRSTKDNRLDVFPNPVSNKEVTFSYSSSADVKTIVIFNTDGQEVGRYELPKNSSTLRVRLPKLAKGVYLARLMGKELSANVKFVVE